MDEIEIWIFLLIVVLAANAILYSIRLFQKGKKITIANILFHEPIAHARELIFSYWKWIVALALVSWLVNPLILDFLLPNS